MMNEIEDFSCSTSCSDISDGKDYISTENPTQSEATKKLYTPQRESHVCLGH